MGYTPKCVPLKPPPPVGYQKQVNTDIESALMQHAGGKMSIWGRIKQFLKPDMDNDGIPLCRTRTGREHSLNEKP